MKEKIAKEKIAKEKYAKENTEYVEKHTLCFLVLKLKFDVFE